MCFHLNFSISCLSSFKYFSVSSERSGRISLIELLPIEPLMVYLLLTMILKKGFSMSSLKISFPN